MIAEDTTRQQTYRRHTTYVKQAEAASISTDRRRVAFDLDICALLCPPVRWAVSQEARRFQEAYSMLYDSTGTVQYVIVYCIILVIIHYSVLYYRLV